MLNHNNFLRWIGSFTPREWSMTSGELVVHLYANQDYIDCDPLSVVTASLGIDSYSFEIISILDFTGGVFGPEITMSEMCSWDGISDLRVFRPVDLSVTDFKILFTYKDVMGNKSVTVYIHVIVDPILVEWVAYPASAVCNLDLFGVNNGFLSWGQLKLINSGTMSDIIPLQLKPNIPADPDYVAPVTDLITCPSPSGTYAPLRISNFSLNGANPVNDFITITQITLACSACGTGGAPLLLNIPCNIAPGETKSVSVPAHLWDVGLTLTYSVNPGGDMVTAPNQVYWKSNTLGVVDNFPTGGPAPVTNVGVYGNFAITIPVTYGITIFCQ